MLDTITDGKKATEQAALKAAEAASSSKNEHGKASDSANSHDAKSGEHGDATLQHIDLPNVGVDKNMNGEEGAIGESADNIAHDNSATEGEALTDEELEAKSHFGVKDAVVAFNVFLLILGGGYYFWHKRQQKQKDKDKELDDDDPIETKMEETPEQEEPQSDMDLEPEDDLSTSISDMDLEGELSSILENEKNDN